MVVDGCGDLHLSLLPFRIISTNETSLPESLTLLVAPFVGLLGGAHARPYLSHSSVLSSIELLTSLLDQWLEGFAGDGRTEETIIGLCDCLCPNLVVCVWHYWTSVIPTYTHYNNLYIFLEMSLLVCVCVCVSAVVDLTPKLTLAFSAMKHGGCIRDTCSALESTWPPTNH